MLYTQIDFAGLIQVLRGSDPLWMVIGLCMVIPTTFFTAWRLQQLMPPKISLKIGEATKLILAASTLNMVLPSKMGDIAKGYFMRDRGRLSGSLALSIVVFEKVCDMLSLLLWCIFGLIFYLVTKPSALIIIATFCTLSLALLGVGLLGSRTCAMFLFVLARRFSPKKMGERIIRMQLSWEEMHDYFWSSRHQTIKIFLTSIFIWLLHLLQIWFFILALRTWTPFVVNLALSPLAIFAGLLPLTFAGVGTRDAALVVLYQSYLTSATGAALGLLCTSRYFLPALGGLPFPGQYLGATKALKRGTASKTTNRAENESS
jgi:uncharacterized protein (TIRG00374 family)